MVNGPEVEMHGVLSDTRTHLVLLGAILVGSGLALMLERVRDEGPLRLWPLLLIVVGAGAAAAGPPHARDEGLWLIGTGVWLLAEALAPILLRTTAPLALALAGLLVFRQSLQAPAGVSEEEVHVR